MRVVCDSSTLINLSKINQLHLLRDMYGDVLIPQGIYDEVVIKGEGKVGSEEVKNASYVNVRPLQNPSSVVLYTHPLSTEDAEVILLALEIGADLIITRDRRLRGRANREGLLAVSLIELFLEAKQTGYIQSVKDQLDQLRAKGVLIREGVYQDALRRAGEFKDNQEHATKVRDT